MARVRWVVAAAIVLGFISQIPVYFAHQGRNQLQVLWRKDTAYACAGRVLYAGRVTLAGAGWCAFMAYFAPRWCYADRERRDLVVVELGPRGLRRHTLEGFPSGGGCYVYGGVLHYGIGVSNPADYPADWRWDGQRFARLPQAAALQQRATYGYTADLHAKDGWHEKQFWKEDEVFTFDLAGTTATVRIDRPWPPATERVFLGVNNVEEPLLIVEEATQRTSAEHYWSIPPLPDRYSHRY